MVKKKSTPFLAFGVILLWGYIITRSLGIMNVDEELMPSTSNTSLIPNVENIPSNKLFKLKNNYPDPFLGGFSAARTKPEKKTISSSPVKTKTNPEITQIPWPKITYGGIIKRKDKEKVMGWITINGKSHIVKEGDTINEVKVIEQDNSAVVIEFQKERRTILKDN